MTRRVPTHREVIAAALTACVGTLAGCRTFATHEGIIMPHDSLTRSGSAEVLAAMRSWRYPDHQYQNGPDPWPSYDAMREAMAARVIEIYEDDAESLPPRDRERAEIMAELARRNAVVVGMPFGLVCAAWGYPTGDIDVTQSPSGTSMFARWAELGPYGMDTTSTASFRDDLLTWWTIE